MTPATSVHLQLHADPEELHRLAVSWRDTLRLRLAVEHFFPDYEVTEIGEGEPLPGERAIDRLALRSAPFDLSATRAFEFAARNEGCLFLLPEPVIRNQMSEAAIGGVTTDPDQAATWRRMMRLIRSQTHKGAVVRGLRSDIAHPLPSHRHTPGAHALAERGVRMVSHLDGPEFLFDDIPR